MFSHALCSFSTVTQGYNIFSGVAIYTTMHNTIAVSLIPRFHSPVSFFVHGKKTFYTGKKTAGEWNLGMMLYLTTFLVSVGFL